MGQFVMMIVLSGLQICWYASIAFACGLLGSIGWHLGKRLTDS